MESEKVEQIVEREKKLVEQIIQGKQEQTLIIVQLMVLELQEKMEQFHSEFCSITGKEDPHGIGYIRACEEITEEIEKLKQSS